MRLTLIAVIGLLAAFEIRPWRQPMAPLSHDAPAWVAWLRDHTPDDAVVAMVPPPPGPWIADFVPTARWLDFQMIHRRALTSGYSSYFPEHIRELNRALAESPGSPAAVAELREHGVGFVVLDPSAPLAPREIENPSLTLVFVDRDSGARVYSLGDLPPRW
jgi:hypothetical protein